MDSVIWRFQACSFIVRAPTEKTDFTCQASATDSTWIRSTINMLATPLTRVFVIVVVALFIRTAAGIVCYQCDSTKPSGPGNCPGWHRRPINTFLDLHDKGGLYTHCVDIRLANGTIILQGAYPRIPSCDRDFMLVWKRTLENRFRQRVYIKCCDYDLCNGLDGRPRPAGGGLLLMVLALSVLLQSRTSNYVWTGALAHS